VADRYVFRAGRFVDPKTGEPMDKPYAGQICMPSVISDVAEHVGPDGKTLITSRSKQREICARTGTVPWEAGVGEKRPRGFTSEKFAKANGTRVCEESQAWMASKKKAIAKAAGLKEGERV
jgi:hypothetical protein